MKMIRPVFLIASLLLCGSLLASDQQDNEQFSIATLNVDGLPQKILVLKVNADGPGDAGTARIGKYLMQKKYDLVMMQEDFNYHGVLSVLLEDDYKFDTWTGAVGLEEKKIDLLHLQNHRFDCDGLMACWKNDLTVTPAVRTAWKQNFGKFSHANDEMVTKGYRRYDVTLRDGSRIVVYNMHMDASDDADEAVQNDSTDKKARMAQWAQLKDDVMSQLDTRPIVIVGDMNSLYGRDAVKREFIDVISESGRGTVADAWVELKRSGVYPSEPVTEQTAGEETLDKILYINPAVGTTIKPVSLTIDRDGYRYDGKPLGDHYPVAATFQITSRGVTAIDPIAPSGSPTWPTPGTDDGKAYYDLNGKRISQPQGGIVIEQQGDKAEKRIIK